MSLVIDRGLVVDEGTSPPTCTGYIFNFQGHGAFSPSGKVKVGDAELDQAQIDEHNRLLAQAEWDALLKRGRGVLYLDDLTGQVSDWTGAHTLKCYFQKKSFHNLAGHEGRTDVWFTLDGSKWHGVNIGDNQILRVRRCKGREAA